MCICTRAGNLDPSVIDPPLCQAPPGWKKEVSLTSVIATTVQLTQLSFHTEKYCIQYDDILIPKR